MSLEDKLLNIVEDYLKNSIYELVQLIYQKEGSSWVIRIFIDKPEGISLDDCTSVSRGLSPILDELDKELNLPDNYSLEVSSPGLDRPLVKLSDFERFKGNDVKIVLKKPQKNIDDKRIRYKGILKGVVENSVLLQLDESEVLISFGLIEKANIIYKF